MQWFRKKPDRLEEEILTLKKYHPHARACIKKGQLTIFLKVVGKKSKYLAKITYPKDFPYDQPVAYILEPKIVGPYEETHRYSNGSLCLAKPSQVGIWVSGKIICDWVKRWVRSYEIWLETDEFPGGD